MVNTEPLKRPCLREALSHQISDSKIARHLARRHHHNHVRPSVQNTSSQETSQVTPDVQKQKCAIRTTPRGIFTFGRQHTTNAGEWRSPAQTYVLHISCPKIMKPTQQCYINVWSTIWTQGPRNYSGQGAPHSPVDTTKRRFAHQVQEWVRRARRRRWTTYAPTLSGAN